MQCSIGQVTIFSYSAKRNFGKKISKSRKIFFPTVNIILLQRARRSKKGHNSRGPGYEPWKCDLVYNGVLFPSLDSVVLFTKKSALGTS